MNGVVVVDREVVFAIVFLCVFHEFNREDQLLDFFRSPVVLTVVQVVEKAVQMVFLKAFRSDLANVSLKDRFFDKSFGGILVDRENVVVYGLASF